MVGRAVLEDPIQARDGVVVFDAPGAPSTIPFWVGEAPGRTVELSAEVSRLREEALSRIRADKQDALDWLTKTCKF